MGSARGLCESAGPGPHPAHSRPGPTPPSICFCAILACVQAIQLTETPAPDTAPTTATATATDPTTATEDSALAADLYALIVFLHKNCNADLFEAVGALELSLSQIKLLHHLEDQPRELSLKEAAEVVHVSMPAASRMVDDLVRRGFAQRREDEDDRRMKRVALTDGGRTAIRRLNAARLSGLEQFATNLTTNEKASLSGALNQLLERDDIAGCRPEGLTP